MSNEDQPDHGHAGPLHLSVFQPPTFSAVPEFVAISLSAQSSPIAATDRDLITHTVDGENGTGGGRGEREEEGKESVRHPKTQAPEASPPEDRRNHPQAKAKVTRKGGRPSPSESQAPGEARERRRDSESLNIDLERARGPAPSIFRISKAQFCRVIQLGHFFVEICESVGFANHNLIMNESRRLPALFLEVRA